ALDQPDTDSFYGWGALMPAIVVAETVDITPWGGLEVTHGESICLGPLLTPLGRTTIDSGSGVISITVGGALRLRRDIRGRFRHLEIGARHVRLELPAGPAGWVEAPGGRILHALLDGHALGAPDTRMRLPARPAPVILEIFREAL